MSMEPSNLRQALQKLQKQREKGLRSGPLLAQMAKIQMALGDYVAAERTWRDAMAIEPGNAQYALALCETMMTLRYFPQALHLLKQIQPVAPSAAVYALAGVCLTKLDRHQESQQAFRKALQMDPTDLTANTYLAGLLWDLSQKDEAQRLLAAALKRSSAHPPALMLKAKMLREDFHTTESLPILRKLMALPQYRDIASSMYANACIDLGDFDEAEAILQKLRQNPSTRPKALYLLTTIGKRTEDAEFEAELRAVLARPDLVPQDRMDVLYAFSKYCDDTGRHGEAIDLAKAAKSLEHKSFDLNLYRTFIAANIQGVTSPRFERPLPTWQPEAQFCFVIGMPRSGTTLTEQTIAKQPGAVSLGEQNFFRNIAKRLGIGSDFNKYVENVFNLTPDERGEIAKAYADHCATLGTGSLYVDKMPHNFEVVPLIRMCLPNAKFVWCQRNPVDICVSIFLNRFPDSHAYSNELGTLGGYYLEHLKLMEHWQSLPELAAFPVAYETFVSDGGALKAALLDFILPGNAGQSERTDGKTSTVLTFSRWQARQPIYQSSIERWRKYAPHIPELLAALGVEA